MSKKRKFTVERDIKKQVRLEIERLGPDRVRMTAVGLDGRRFETDRRFEVGDTAILSWDLDAFIGATTSNGMAEVSGVKPFKENLW